MIVGGGTAGAALASRLSEAPSQRVLLVEAGQDAVPGNIPPDIQDPFPTSTLNSNYFWEGLTAVGKEGGIAAPYPQARVMGGGSSINGMFALRGVPSDYARWAEAVGRDCLAWDAMLPYFRKIENDRARKGFQHGCHAILRTPREQWPAFARAMEVAAKREGYPFIDDINEQPEDGFFSMPNAIENEERVGSANCYLTAKVRARPNLRIMSETLVTRLLLKNGVVSGVDAIRNGMHEQLQAHRVVVAAGGIYSPALLLRSGIGPASELSELGIQPVLNLAGVGRNLQNHPYMFFALTLPRGKRVAQELRRFAVTGLRSSSGMAGVHGGDLFNFVIGRVSGKSFGPDFALVGSALYAPRSRGFVKLRSADPLVQPEVNFRFLSDPADPPRLVQAARLAERLLRNTSVAGQYHEAFLLPGALAVKQFNRPGLAGQALSWAAQAAANSPTVLRRMIFGRAFGNGGPAIFSGGGRSISDQELMSSISPMGHPVGTCAMGKLGDEMAVVDESFRVFGTQNLFVVDASVMPSIPSANTNLPTLALAEVAADRLAATVSSAA